MKITAIEAVYHIVNSLENSDADYWFDNDNDVTWAVRTSAPGVISISFIDDDDSETTQKFLLTEMF